MTTFDKKRNRVYFAFYSLVLGLHPVRQKALKMTDRVTDILNGPLTTCSHDLLKTDLKVAHERRHKRMFSLLFLSLMDERKKGKLDFTQFDSAHNKMPHLSPVMTDCLQNIHVTRPSLFLHYGSFYLCTFCPSEALIMCYM